MVSAFDFLTLLLECISNLEVGRKSHSYCSSYYSYTIILVSIFNLFRAFASEEERGEEEEFYFYIIGG